MWFKDVYARDFTFFFPDDGTWRVWDQGGGDGRSVWPLPVQHQHPGRLMIQAGNVSRGWDRFVTTSYRVSNSAYTTPRGVAVVGGCMVYYILYSKLRYLLDPPGGMEYESA